MPIPLDVEHRKQACSTAVALFSKYRAIMPSDDSIERYLRRKSETTPRTLLRLYYHSNSISAEGQQQETKFETPTQLEEMVWSEALLCVLGFSNQN